jgi:very-short-patch-repair endonuclease
MPTPAVLAEIRRATRPHGVATGDAFDLSEAQLSRCVGAGVLERPVRGVFVDPSSPPSPVRDLAVAVAAGGPLAAAWARSAGALWGTVLAHPPQPEIVVPYRRRVRVPGIGVHRARGFDVRHRVKRSGIWTIDPLTTTIDLGMVLSALEVAETIIRGRQLHLFEPVAVRNRLDDIARVGRNGVTTTRDALELVYIGARPADSVAELRFHLGPAAHGLPPYVFQHPVTIGGRRFRIDFAYPTVMLAIEIDGKEKLSIDGALEDMLHRQNALVLANWTVLRFTWSDICDRPAQTARQILLKLAQLGFVA